jgi:hypothetical protein
MHKHCLLASDPPIASKKEHTKVKRSGPQKLVTRGCNSLFWCMVSSRDVHVAVF